MTPVASAQLPYLVHTNRELGLMLRGSKPLSYFLEVAGRESGCLLRYLLLFDRHAAAGQLIRREYRSAVPMLPHLVQRSIFYALPGHEWRIEALRRHLAEQEPLTPERERVFGELLGYEDWQNDCWIKRHWPAALG